TIARDIRERKAYEARLQYLANYDPLTGLPNRDLLGDRTLQAVAHARRASRPAALLVLNLDRFKLVNESYSHGAGDTLLRMVADRLKSTVREGDTVARLGGDAFAVLATDLARPDDVLSVARKIHGAMHSPFLLEGRDLHVTLSIGASVTPRDGEEFDMLLRNANIANSVVVARDGQEAVDFLFGTGPHAGREPQTLPAVVLLDLKLPKLDGIDVLHRIRADPRTKLVPVVVLTSSSEDEDMLRSYQSGANSYVRKPIDFSHFASAVTQL